MKKPTQLGDRHYATILDSIEDGVFTVDKDMRIMSFNSAAEKITGISRQEAVGRECFEVLKADICETGCLLSKTIKTRKPIMNMPVHIMRGDNRQIPISVNTTVLRDSKGRIMGGVETFRDLSTVHELRKALDERHTFEDIVSKNQKMNKLFGILPQIAESSSTVLIQGDSGTGKELVAKAIHNNSLRKKGPFEAMNCGALPDTLCDSELFGHKAGAFTDAKKDKPGRFAMAQNGTLFLDEIGDISEATQIRLLRVLEEKIYEPLGGTKKVSANARVIAATHRNLQDLVKEGKFREDLFFRINVIKLSLPTLAERKEDIPLLVNRFIDRFNELNGRKILGLSQEAMASLMHHDWPGNVRELENAIEHAFVLCQADLIGLEHLPDHIHPVNESPVIPSGLTLKDAEKRTIEQALEKNQWKRVATARELGIDKNTLRRKIKRLGIETPP